ncbi:hypothetical protein JCM10212_005223 [Sporobolomyces blumeae]
MHGVKRTRIPPTADSAEVEHKRLVKTRQRIDEYSSLVRALQDNVRVHQDYSDETLALSARVLEINPEFQTGWGLRRNVLLNGPLKDADPQARQRTLEQDLALTNLALRSNPKIYAVWEHRKWVLETMPDADWAGELKLVDLFLEKDGRNFHSWDYRRYLIESILSLGSEPDPSSSSRTKPLPNPTTESELAYTTRKISANFSNFSAWHYRTKLLSRLWEERGIEAGSQERAERVDQEFDLVKQAIWSDPNDQSAWLYHRWLVGSGTIPLVRREIQGIEELLEEEPDSRWCLDSLVHYKRLLSTLLASSADSIEDGQQPDHVDASQTTNREEREKLALECRDMLNKLQEVDPMRRNRYVDIGLQIIPARR